MTLWAHAPTRIDLSGGTVDLWPLYLLIDEAAVKSMRAGSVIVDLAAEQGGNCACTKPDGDTVAHGVTIIAAATTNSCTEKRRRHGPTR